MNTPKYVDDATMRLNIDSKLKARFPDLTAHVLNVKDVKIQKRATKLEKFKTEVMKQIRKDFDLASIKDHPIFRAYRDFFWRVD